MASRWQSTVVALCTLLATSSTHADIYRWDTGDVIPGTEGIEPGPGANLSHLDLRYARLQRADLAGADFEASNLANARLHYSVLDDATFNRANLVNASLEYATLFDAEFEEAKLTNANLHSSDLSGVRLRGADVTMADLSYAELLGADFSGAVVTRAVFRNTRLRGLSREQLYSTANYQARDLRGVVFDGMDLDGWDLTGQDVTAASFVDTTINDLQLYSTGSYQSKTLRGIDLRGTDLSGWDLSGQDLSHACLEWTNLADARLIGSDLTYVSFWTSDLTNTDFSNAIIAGTSFYLGGDGAPHSQNLSREQVYSTASYKAKDLRGIDFGESDLSGMDLSGQDLTNARLRVGPDTELKGANLRNAGVYGHPVPGVFDNESTYNQWTGFDISFDPLAAGLTFAESSAGDFDGDDLLSVSDVDLMTSQLQARKSPPYHSACSPWLFGLEEMFDLNNDDVLDQEDHRIWIKELNRTWYGDADLDFEFDSSDLVRVFAGGMYEREANMKRSRAIVNPISWSQGDWNGDGVFDSSDMVTAFADGGYEKGPRTDAVAVPEPNALALLCLGLLFWLSGHLARRLV